MQAALEHEGAGHAWIILEVAGEKPIVGPDGRDGAQVTTLPGSAFRIEIEHALHQQHLVVLDGGRAHMGLASFETGAETRKEIALGKRADIFSGELPPRTNHRGRVQACVAPDLLARGRPQHAGRLVQLFCGEETRLAMAHGERRAAVDGAVIVKEEQADFALARVAVHMDIVAKRFAQPRQATVVGQLATQQAIPAPSLVETIDAKVRDEKQIGLPGLDHDPRGHESAMQKPRILAHVRLGPHRAQPHRSGQRVHAHHPIGKQQGRLGHAHLDRVSVL